MSTTAAMGARRRLRRFRTDRQMTQVEAAGALGCSISYYWRLEQGEAMPSLELASRIEEWSGGEVGASEWCRQRTARAA